MTTTDELACLADHCLCDSCFALENPQSHNAKWPLYGKMLITKKAQSTRTPLKEPDDTLLGSPPASQAFGHLPLPISH